MTETLKHKMREAGLPEDDTLRVEFDISYSKKKKKMVTIHGIKSIANMCPVIIHGTQTSKRFAWVVGLGNGTGSRIWSFDLKGVNMKYYVVKYAGPFGFIKPWTAVVMPVAEKLILSSF